MNRRALAIAGLCVLIFVVYLPALRNRFIWDDDDHLTKNAAVQSPDGLRKIWSSLAVSRYYPLTLTTFWCEYRLWGLNPLPYHAVNIAMHALAAVLLFLTLRQLAVPGAWVVAALWAVHPLNVESVAWITEMKNTQAGAFFFLTLWLFVQPATRSRYLLALVTFAAALASKPSTVTLPVVLLLIIWWQRRRYERRDFLRVLPFFALSAAMSLLTVAEQQRHMQASGYEWTLTLLQRVQLASLNLWFYAAKLVWPVKLMFVYPRWQIDSGTLSAWLPIVGVVIVAIVLAALHRRPWAAAGIFGIGYFAAMLLPVLGLADVYYFRFSFVADHFQYLAGVGLMALAVTAARRWLSTRPVQVGLAAIALVALGGMSWSYCRVFYDEETLWRDTLAKNPVSFMPHNNLGQLLSTRGDYAEAESHLRKALELMPRAWEARMSLATFLGKTGRTEEALGQYRLVLKAKPQLGEAHFNTAVLLARLGRRAEAYGEFRKATELMPEFDGGYLMWSQTLADDRQFAEAVSVLRRGLKTPAHSLRLLNQLGWLLAVSPDDAVRDPVEAVRIADLLRSQTEEREAEPLDTAAAAYASAGRFEEAVAMARKAQVLAGQPLAAEIAARLVLYDRHEPYRLQAAHP